MNRRIAAGDDHPRKKPGNSEGSSARQPKTSSLRATWDFTAGVRARERSDPLQPFRVPSPLLRMAAAQVRAANELRPAAPVVEDEIGRDALDEMERSGGTTAVEETFRPEEFDTVPDEHLHFHRVDERGAVISESQEEEDVHAPPSGFVDAERTGTARYGVQERDRKDLRPHAFTDMGRTATTSWSGGGGAGARGNEATGSIQEQVPPVYKAASSGTPPTSTAWIRVGTGRIRVSRSWTGIDPGDQGTGYYVTPGAAARINQHETLHVASTRGLYNTHLAPLLARVLNYTPAADGGGGNTAAGATPGAASAALQGIIAWATSVSAFQTADVAANKPGGTVDTGDLASGTYPVNAGPGTVAGTAFAHRIRLPGEPNPP